MQVEVELLLVLLRWPLTESIKPRISELLADGIDWNAFAAKALQWRVEAVAFGNLRIHFADVLPDDVAERLAGQEKESRARTLAQTLVFMDLLKRFEAKGIDAIVLKGPAIGLAAYGDVTLRAYGDMDLLVRREALAFSRDVLVDLGYTPLYEARSEGTLVRNQHALEFMSRTSKVELHWNLLERHLAVATDIDELWRTSLTVDCAGSQMRTLSIPNQFVFACMHGAKHQWLVVSWILDVFQFAQRLNQSEVKQVESLAVRLQCEELVVLALQVASAVVGPFNSGFTSGFIEPEKRASALTSNVRLELGLSHQRQLRFGRRLFGSNTNVESLLFWMRARKRRRWLTLSGLLFATSDEQAIISDRFTKPTRIAFSWLWRW